MLAYPLDIDKKVQEGFTMVYPIEDPSMLESSEIEKDGKCSSTKADARDTSAPSEQKLRLQLQMISTLLESTS